ncbi:hypothetical protein MFLAVUS_000206 [Mucor flavus]|uniref:V-type proton ATPase subunit H n=1 Tax=Mucor flavus TaxID=439312 RepID=A0ABP9YJ28_9FUNG
MLSNNTLKKEGESDAVLFARNDLVHDVKVTIISHPYLDDMLDKIRTKDIPWEEYKHAGLITEDEVAMIKHVENKSMADLTPIMAEHGLYYAALYLDLMQKLARVDALQKVLVLIHDMLDDHEERISLFHDAGKKDGDFPFGPFHNSTRERDIDINEFFRWMTFQLQSPLQHVVDLNIQILDALFHIPEYRRAFWDTTHATDSLVNILKKSTAPQKVYELTFAVWLLSFDIEVAKNLDRRCQVIPTLIELAKSAVKEKVIRVIIATFRNFIEKAPAENMSAMLVAKLLPLCEQLSTRKWADPEIADDIAFTQSELQRSFQSLSTFEVYVSELETGMLQWSPSHLSENFWKQNATRLNENNQKLLRQLARILSASPNPVVLAVACHDVGQYVKYNSKDGRKNLEIIGAKQRVMELMTHQDSDVRYHALSATQKYFAMTS